MAKNSSKLTDTVRTAVITVLASGAVFYMLGTMKNEDADLYISSETYKYSEITHIFGDTAEPSVETELIADEDISDETEAAVTADVLAGGDEDGVLTESGDETGLSGISAVAVPITAETEQESVGSTPAAAESDDLENVVYWVTGGEVWHITDKCSSLSRSKKILSGTVEQAMSSGKSRACKLCGD